MYAQFHQHACVVHRAVSKENGHYQFLVLDSTVGEEEATAAVEQYSHWHEEKRWGLCSYAGSC